MIALSPASRVANVLQKTVVTGLMGATVYFGYCTWTGYRGTQRMKAEYLRCKELGYITPELETMLRPDQIARLVDTEGLARSPATGA